MFSLKFADGGDQYTFTNVQRFNPDFADAVNATVRAVGVHGGVDQFGGEDAPDAVASLAVSFLLTATSRADMQAKRDAVAALKTLGVQKLYWQPTGTLNQRFCYARIDSVRFSQQPARQTDYFQRGQVNFHISDPRWYETEEYEVINASGTTTDETITNAGNAPALARLVLAPGSGDSCENPVISRRVSGVAEDQISYAGVLIYGDTLTINAETKAVTLGSVNAYSDVTILRPRWFVLMPGSNSIRVALDNPGDAVDVTVYWKDTYR